MKGDVKMKYFKICYKNFHGEEVQIAEIAGKTEANRMVKQLQSQHPEFKFYLK